MNTEETLRNWNNLNDVLRTATEEECWFLLRQEGKGKRRISFLLRIQARYNVLRSSRERKELLQEIS